MNCRSIGKEHHKLILAFKNREQIFPELIFSPSYNLLIHLNMSSLITGELDYVLDNCRLIITIWTHGSLTSKLSLLKRISNQITA